MLLLEIQKKVHEPVCYLQMNKRITHICILYIYAIERDNHKKNYAKRMSWEDNKRKRKERLKK